MGKRKLRKNPKKFEQADRLSDSLEYMMGIINRKRMMLDKKENRFLIKEFENMCSDINRKYIASMRILVENIESTMDVFSDEEDRKHREKMFNR